MDRHLSTRKSHVAGRRNLIADRRVAASAGASDDIRDTVDYAVVERLSDLAASHFNLVEKLTEHISTWLLKNFAAQWVRVSVAKLGMMPGVKRVGVIIERSV